MGAAYAAEAEAKAKVARMVRRGGECMLGSWGGVRLVWCGVVVGREEGVEKCECV